MPDLKKDDDSGSVPVSFVVETADNKNYRIWSGDIKAIAAQLRGKAPFSVFNSIILPIFITFLTALLTTAIGQSFQYISWRNSSQLQKAQEQVSRAEAAYGKAAAAIAERYYATFVYTDTVADLVKRKKDINTHLYRLDIELNKRRFEEYYDQLKRWNESNEQILGEIDFALDRPVGIAARKRSAEMEKIDCAQSLTQQLKKQNLNSASLKLHFAVISRCFTVGVRAFSAMKDRATDDATFAFDDKTKNDAVDALNNILSMSNVFRCYALNRIEFLKTRQGRAIYFPDWLAPFFGRQPVSVREATDKKKHFEDAENYCAF